MNSLLPVHLLGAVVDESVITDTEKGGFFDEMTCELGIPFRDIQAEWHFVLIDLHYHSEGCTDPDFCFPVPSLMPEPFHQ